MCFILVLLRPFPSVHAWGWWLCYNVLASWVQVGLHLVQTAIVLVYWVVLMRHEMRALRAHLRTLWQLHSLQMHLNAEAHPAAARAQVAQQEAAAQ